MSKRNRKCGLPILSPPIIKKFGPPLIIINSGLIFFVPLLSSMNPQSEENTTSPRSKHAFQRGENVILLANHQTEPDPQIISILLEKKNPVLAEEMIFVAGHRVVTDPVAIPFSKGRNLLCIYSKRYIEDPPEQREAKTLHNRRALEKLKELLKEGGKCVMSPQAGAGIAQALTAPLSSPPSIPPALSFFASLLKILRPIFILLR